MSEENKKQEEDQSDDRIDTDISNPKSIEQYTDTSGPEHEKDSQSEIQLKFEEDTVKVEVENKTTSQISMEQKQISHNSNRHSEILQGQESDKSLSKENTIEKATDLGRSASHNTKNNICNEGEMLTLDQNTVMQTQAQTCQAIDIDEDPNGDKPQTNQQLQGSNSMQYSDIFDFDKSIQQNTQCQVSNDFNTKDSSSVPDVTLLKQEQIGMESQESRVSSQTQIEKFEKIEKQMLKKHANSLHDIEEEKSRTGSSNYQLGLGSDASKERIVYQETQRTQHDSQLQIADNQYIEVDHVISNAENKKQVYQQNFGSSGFISEKRNNLSQNASMIKASDQASFYRNPNEKNELSMMNISHLSGTFNSAVAAQNFANSPGMFVEGEEASKIFTFVTSEDYKGLMQYLRIQSKPLDLMKMMDSRKFTVLTYAAYRNQTNCFKILFEYAWRYGLDEQNLSVSQVEKMQNWVNMKTEDEFTALHFATRHGNYTMLSLLCEKANADMYIQNKYGSTAIHIAAQQDQPLSIYYLYKQGVDINIRDSKQSTPLHWACFTRSEMALNYILSMKPDLEAQDIFGFTPLHIAVTTVEKLGSTRNVKALLLKGADRTTKDFKDKTPLDHVKQKPVDEDEPEMHKEELLTYLAKQSYWECLMLRVPLIPLKKNHKTQLLFLTLFAIVHLLNMVIILPTLEVKYSYYTQLGNGISTICVFLSFLYASCKDPGVLKPFIGQSFLELLRDINPADLCPECKVIRSARSRHCAICNQCVERFDHHCPWINNCVGIKNHNAFLLFLFTIWVKIVFTGFFDVQSLVFFLMKTEDFVCDQEQCLSYCLNSYCQNDYIHIASCSVCIIICCFYFLLSTVLLYTHCKNYMANRTTNERFSRKAKKVTADEDEDASEATSSMWSMSDFDHSSLLNSVLSEERENLGSAKRKNKKKGCCINCWKMSTHTTIVPQKKLYNYLAERSTVLSSSDLILSNNAELLKKEASQNSDDHSGMMAPSPFSQGHSALIETSM